MGCGVMTTFWRPSPELRVQFLPPLLNKHMNKGGITMSRRMGVGYLGSDALQISIANQEIVPKPPEHWTIGYHLYKFSLMNYDDCTLIINGKTELFIKANQGFNTDTSDASITSVKIKESGVRYNWIGAY